MKKIVNLSKAILLAMCVTFTLSFFYGCEKESDPRDAYEGTWRVTERIIGVSEVDYYNVTISKSSINKKDIVMNNFFNVSSVALLITVDGNSFNIPQQTFVDVGFSGSGRKDGNTLKFSVMANATGGLTLNLDVEAIKM